MTGIADVAATPTPAHDRGSVKRLAIFTSHPIQYQAPFFRALAATGRVAPTVYFGSRHGLDVTLDTGFGTAFRWDVPLLDGYDHVFLPNAARHPDVSRFMGVRVREFGDVLRHERPDALLVLGWHTLAHVQAVRAAWEFGVPVMVRGESTLQRTPTRGARGVVRRIAWLPLRRRAYRRAFQRVGAFLAIGSRNRDYYRAFGVPDEKLFWAPYGVDNAWFALAEPARSLARDRVRTSIGAHAGSVLFASSAKLIARKRPFDLVDAVADLRRQGMDARALFIGDGEERSALERRAASARIADAVSITGFVNQSELPAWYAAADCLVLPSDSRETWGLVVNEAMAAGLPVVVSDAAGCSADLVRDGRNGFVYPCGDVPALGATLARVVELGVAGRRAFGDASRDIVAEFSIDVAVAGALAALEVLTRNAAPGASARSTRA